MNFTLDVIAKPTLILLMVAALSMLLRRCSAAVRYAVWILALGSAILLPIAVLLVPQFEWSVMPHASTSVMFLRIENVHDAVSRTREMMPAATYLPGTLPIQPVFIWMIGIAFLLLRLIASTAAVRRMTNNTVTIIDDHWRKLILELSEAFRIRRPVRLLFSDQHVSPMTWGVWNPTILLPSAAAQWSEERRRLVLAHELAHVKRGDGALQIFVQIVCSVYWFNPLVWYAA